MFTCPETIPFAILLVVLGFASMICICDIFASSRDLTSATFGKQNHVPVVKVQNMKKVVMHIASMYDIYNTPRKFNMEPENETLEKKIPFGNHHFQVPC